MTMTTNATRKAKPPADVPKVQSRPFMRRSSEKRGLDEQEVFDRKQDERQAKLSARQERTPARETTAAAYHALVVSLFRHVVAALPGASAAEAAQTLASLEAMGPPPMASGAATAATARRANERFVMTSGGVDAEVVGWLNLMESTGYAETTLRNRFSVGGGTFTFTRHGSRVTVRRSTQVPPPADVG